MGIWNGVKGVGCRGLALILLCGGVPGLAAAADVDVQVSSFTDSPDPAIRGGQITYTTVVKNGGPAIATDVLVTWPVPATTTFESVSDGTGGGGCTHNNVTPPGQVTCAYASVPVDDLTSATSKTITLVVQTGASTLNTVNSSVSVSQTGNTDTGPGNNAGTQNTTINAGADLSFAISGAPKPSVGAGNVTWSITGSNLGPDTSGPVTVTVPIPGTLTYQSGTGTGWTCNYSAPNAVCTRAALASGAPYPTLAIVTKIASQIADGTLTVGGNISQATVADPVLANNTATDNVTVNPGLDLQITQDAPSPSSANAGGSAMTFVLRPSNLGPYAATTGANVTFPLPADFTLTSATGTNGWTCSSAGTPITVTCSLAGSMVSGTNSVLTIVTGTPPTVTASTAFTLTGTVAVNASGPTDPIAANNTAARTVTVTPIGLDLSVGKTKTPALVAEGATLTTTINIASAAGGVQAAAGTITVTDVLDPAFETYVSSSGTNWVCSATTLPAASQTVTCTYNATLNGGSNAPALIITTTAVAAGTATNSASVAYSGTPGDYNPANNGPVFQSTVTTAVIDNAPDLIAGLTVSTAGGAATTVETNESSVSFIATLTNALATADDAVNTRMTLTIPARVTGGTSMAAAITVALTNTSGSSTATYTCTPGVGILATSTIVCTQNAGILKPGDLVTFTVPVSRPLFDGTFTNPPNVTVDSTTQGDPIPGNNTATATVIIEPVADVEMASKLITSANPAKAGTEVTYVLTVKNKGPSSAANVSVSDVFTVPPGDSGFTFISAAPTVGSCAGLTAGDVVGPGTATLTCTLGTLTNDNTQTITVKIRPNWMTGNPIRTLSNTASVTTTTVENPAGGDNGNNSKTATLAINAADVDALINNIDIPDPLGYDPAAGAIGTASANNDVTYNVTVTNNGPSLVSGVGFTYTMTAPAGKTITFRGDGAAANTASTTPSGTIAGICDNLGNAVTGATLTLTCTFAAPGQLTNQATVNRYLVFRVGSAPATAGDTYNTNATVFTNETDSNGANNSEAEATTVRQRVDLTIAKTPTVNPVQLRQPFNWTITLTNTGPGNSDTTTLIDTLPAGMAFFGAAPSFTTTGVVKTGTCGVSGQVMTCNISTGSASPLNVGEVATITVPVRMTTYPSSGTTQNCATATTDQVDPAAGNNTSVCTDLTVQRSSIAGRVFHDPNRNGLFDFTTGATGTDTGMNVSNIVVLTGTDAYGNAVNLTQSTSGSAGSAGVYLFNDLSPADAAGYTVTETQPATHINGPVDPPAPTLSGTPTAGDQGVYARGGLAGNSIYSAIKLAANQAGTNYNFPELRRPTLSGRVYVDVNGNNTYTSGADTNIQGATVVLRNAADLGNSVATVTTAADGTYSFTLLDPLITYVLEEPLPTTPAGLGNRATAVNVGTVNAVATGTAVANSPSVNTDRITGIDLSLGVDGINYNFGEDLATSISGLVYNDRNRDGGKNGTEPGVEGVSLKLVAGTDCTAAAFVYTGLVNPATTAATTGAYSFSPVPAGAQYTICQTQPDGYADGPVGGVTTSITIASLSSTGSANNNFPEVLGSISGKVFADFGSGVVGNNNNGTQEGSEPGIGSGTANLGVPMTLTGTPTAGPVLTPISITVYTNASGDYSFADVFPGSYTVSQGVIPSALGTFNDGINTAGPVTPSGTPGTAGAVGVNTISNIGLVAGSLGTGNNFAELPVTSISGFIYLDVNENNQMDTSPTDDRIGGATLTLYAGSACSGSVVGTTTSAPGTGTFSFLNLSAGLTYTVCETQPAGFEEGAVNPGTNAALTGGAGGTPNAITVTNLLNTGSANNNFGERVGIDLRVSKTHTPTTFTTDNIGTYTLRVRNAGLQASSDAYTVTDNLPAGMTLAAVPSGTSWVCTGAVGATSMACTSSLSIAAGAINANAITVRVNVPASVAAAAQPVYNVVYVEGGGEPDQKKPTAGDKSGPASALTDCDSNITQNICRDPTNVILSASLSGTVWYDVGPQSRVLESGDRRLPGWTVEVLDATNSVIGSAVTGANGAYLIDKLPAKVALSVRFREPSSNVIWGYPVNGELVSGSPVPCDETKAISDSTKSSCVVRSPNSQLAVVLQPGANLAEQSLPVDPSGVVYDAVTRLPVPGSTVTLAPAGLCTGWNPATAIVGAGAGGYSIVGANISMTVGTDGFYQYLFAPGAPASCSFALSVLPPPTHRFVSGIIPPEVGTLSPPGGSTAVYLVQPQAVAPTVGVGLGTRYFLNVTAGSAVAGIIHNHIPLDPGILTKLVLTKTGDRRLAEIGDTVVYTLSVRNVAGEALPQVTLRDRLPAGFTLVKGTVQIQLGTGAWAAAANPSGNLGPVLGFNLGSLGVNATTTVQYRVRVGVGALQGTGINFAKAHGCGAVAGCLDLASLQPLAGSVDSNEGQHKVVVTGGVFTTDACLLGKVFVDCNNNHIQDAEELGIPGVRLYFSDGRFVVTDVEGKYSRCGMTPRSHVLTADPSTLPTGSRLTTSSNRNLGDADSLFLDLKNGELHRGDFIEGSCTNQVLEQVKARRSQGEVRSVETEKPAGPALRFRSKPPSYPQQGTDAANQPLVAPRTGASDAR